MRRLVTIALMVFLAPGCDSGGGVCPRVTCGMECEHGFQHRPDGCEICRCASPPDESCSSDSDCVIAGDASACCGCPEAYSLAALDADPCLVRYRETAPDGCPGDCEGLTCGPCGPFPVRAICTAGRCTSSEECEAGSVVFVTDVDGGAFRVCTPACASHADCVMAADYGFCCGGCEPAPVAFVDEDPCYAERQSESSCASGACDGLGCRSPPTDCTLSGGSAVCMSDGTCQLADPGGGCPAGSSDTGGVCTPD